MDRSQAGDFSVSLSNQITSLHTQGSRQQVNIIPGRDGVYNVSHSQPPSRQQQDGSHETTRQDLPSTIYHNKSVTSSYSSFPTENYTQSQVHHSQNDNTSHQSSLSKQRDISGIGSQPSLEYWHRIRQHDTNVASEKDSQYSQSQTTYNKSYTNNQNTQQQQQTVPQNGGNEQNFQKGNFKEESREQIEHIYEHEVKEDSEIKIAKSDIQYLGIKVENQSNLYAREANNQSQTGNANTSSPPDDAAVVSQSSDITTDITTDKSTIATATSQILQLTSDKAHVCLICYKTFKNKPQLNQHELVHNGLRKHVCMYCDKAFKQVCHLNQHTRVHTGERPYKCLMEGCDRAFAQLSNLNHHMKNHEDHVRRDISKQYRCEVCDRSYANQNSLHTHIQKLHMNLKATEGSTANPIVVNTPTKKRKKKNKQFSDTDILPDSGGLSVQALARQYVIQITDSDDDGLPTQVKTKSLKDFKFDSLPAPRPADSLSIQHTLQDKNQNGQKVGLSVSPTGQSEGVMYTAEKLSNLQQFTKHSKTEHRAPMVLNQTGQETQLSQTYSPGHVPTTNNKPDNPPSIDTTRPRTQNDAVQSTSSSTTNGCTTTSAALPFLVQSSPSITSHPIPSSLFSTLPGMSSQLSQSDANAFSSTVHHHFNEAVGTHAERDFRNMAAAQNFFNPAFAEQTAAKSEQNRFR